MTKKRARGFTPDGFIKIQRTVLRRCITDRLQALLNGEFSSRHDISDDDYDSLVNEIKGLNVAPVAVAQPCVDVGGVGKDGDKNGKNGKVSTDTKNTTSNDGTPQSNKPPPEQQPTNTFSSNLETFIQIIASSIMIDATLRGENAGESDTRFIKKKKKILIKTIQGPKLSDFIKEVERYDMIKKGIEFDEEEIVESEDSDDDSSSSEEEESDMEDMDKKMPAKKKTKYSKIAAAHAAAAEKNKSSTGKDNNESSDSEDEMSVTSKSSKSSTLTNENSTLDGFSTSQADSSANNKLTKKEKKERKRLKKEKKRLKKEEKRKLKKERKRKEKEERKKKRKLEKQLEKKKKSAAAATEGGGGKKSKKKRKQEEDKKLAAAADEDEEEVSVDNEDDESMEDASQQEESDNEEEGVDNEEDNDDEPTIYEIATKSNFDKYKADLLSRVPKAVKSRFREGGFSRWGKDWLPVLELGPFDVEPGPVRDMWLDMFDNVSLYIIYSVVVPVVVYFFVHIII